MSSVLSVRTRLRGPRPRRGEGPGFAGSRPKRAPLGTDPRGPGVRDRVARETVRAAGAHPVGCSGRSAETSRGPPRSPRAAGTPPAGGPAAAACPPGPLKASHALGTPCFLSHPSKRVGGVCQKVCIPILHDRGLVLELPGSQNVPGCPSRPEAGLPALLLSLRGAGARSCLTPSSLPAIL